MLSKFKNFPNIVNVHKVFIDDNKDGTKWRDWKYDTSDLVLTTVLDLCYYGNLYDIVGKAPKKKLHWTVARHIAGQIVSFLERAHCVEGISSNFLNPRNILFGKSLIVKVNDFRFASFFRDPEKNVFQWTEGLDIDADEHIP